MTQKRKLKTIKISEAWFDFLIELRPEYDGNGSAWAIEALIADTINLTRPMTPQQARVNGAAKRGEQLQGKAALNPAGRKKKASRLAE